MTSTQPRDIHDIYAFKEALLRLNLTLKITKLKIATVNRCFVLKTDMTTNFQIKNLIEEDEICSQIQNARKLVKLLAIIILF